MKNYDVTALGELLIDFTENGLSRQGNFLMEANPGGAPCNVLAMLTKCSTYDTCFNSSPRCVIDLPSLCEFAF